MWDLLVAGRGSQLVTDEGTLAGPFNAWVHAPEAGSRLAELGGHLRFHTSMERRLSEVAIITVGARWKAEFEWWAHSPMAVQQGVPEAAVDAIGRGEEPTFEADDEGVVYRVARQLADGGRVDDATYASAQTLLGGRRDGRARVALRVLHADLVPAQRLRGAPPRRRGTAVAGWRLACGLKS